MTCVIRIEALEAFAKLVESRIPELAGRVCAGQAPSSEMEEVPNLSIEPTRWMYDMDDAAITATLPGNVVVYDVGVHRASCVISIVTSSTSQRAVLEAKVLDLFLGAVDPLGFRTPGTLTISVSDCPEVGRWTSTFELDSDQWVEMYALDRRYESRIVCDVEIPALTVARPVYQIRDLMLGVVSEPPAGADPRPIVDLAIINPDGTLSISPVTP